MSYLDRPSLSGDWIVGALLSIGSASAATVAAFLVLTIPEAGPVVLFAWPAAFIVFLFGMPVATVALLLFAVPATFLLQALRAEGAIAYTLTGAIAGGVTVRWIVPTYQVLPTALLAGIVGGAVGGFVWWRAFRRHFQDIGD